MPTIKKKKTQKATKKKVTTKKAGTKKAAKKASTKKTAKAAPKKATATKKAKTTKTPAKKSTTKVKTNQTPSIETKSLRVGDTAPDFTLESDSQGRVSLNQFRGDKNVVLYFYPKDDTPGCTTQACAFQAAESSFEDVNAVVIGVSPDNLESHAKFRNKFGLKFILVSDEDHKVAEDYGVWVLKNNYGKKYMGIQRTTFIIDKEGIITHIWPRVSVDGHDQKVLEALRGQN